MIESSYQEVHSKEWLSAKHLHPNHELSLLRQVIPWQKLIDEIQVFYHPTQGRFGNNLRMMIALVILGKLYQLSEPETIVRTQENRYYQYFCNISNAPLSHFSDRSTLGKFRSRLGVKGTRILEQCVFERLRLSGAINADDMLMDSSCLANHLIYPNDVHLVVKAFKKLEAFAQRFELALWWDQTHLRKRWREFQLEKTRTGLQTWLEDLSPLLCEALRAFKEQLRSWQGLQKKQRNAY